MGQQIGLRDIELARRYKNLTYKVAISLFLAISYFSFYSHLPEYVMVFTSSPELSLLVGYDNVKKFSLPFVIAAAYFPDALKLT
jgi:Na+-driven multidrug efflux pump